ncbi:hypothetical protein Pelo_12018 [Pelomyxa schiedti]|nr:hypothetical protein Pelo_12018 [Pelomyxa schiedti]
MSAATTSDAAITSNGGRRVVWISASYLSKFYTAIPEDVMRQSIFFFGSDRSWVFPRTPAEEAASRRQPTRYLDFSPRFKDLILQKEQEGLVYWLKPNKNFEEVSAFFQTIDDPTTGSKYKPLILDKMWWKERTRQQSKYNIAGINVVQNFLLGEHDYQSVKELLFQSNPSLMPALDKKEISL